MVIYDKANILKQQRILGGLLNEEINSTNEYEAQKIINQLICKTKDEYGWNNLLVSSYIKDGTLTNWKTSRSESDYFVKIFYNEINYVKETYGLTNLEVSFLYEISQYLAWETNLLINEEGQPINQKMLITLTKMDKKKISNCTKSLENKKCLIRIWDGKFVYYLINPNLMFKGTKINRGIPKLFSLLGYINSKDSKK